MGDAPAGPRYAPRVESSGRRARASFGDRAAIVGLVVLAWIGLDVRKQGLDAMLPHALEPDSDIVLQVELLDGGEGNRLKLQKYPHLVAHLVRLVRAVRPPAELPPDAGLHAHRRRASEPVLAVRRVVALLSLLIVPATYALARVWLAPGWSLVAAAFALTSLLMQSLGQQARPHAPVAALVAVAVAACLWLRRRPSVGTYAVAGATTGLALGALQSGALAVLALGAAHLFRAGERRASDHVRVLVAVALVGVAAVAFYPFYFFDAEPAPVGVEAPVTDEARPARDLGAPTEDLQVTDAAVRHGQHRIVWTNFDGSGFRRILEHVAAYDPVLGGLALVGLAYGLFVALRVRDGARRRGADLLVVLAGAGAYFVVLALYRNTLARYVLPLVPYFACLAAGGLAALAGAVSRARPSIGVGAGIGLAGMALAFPGYACWRLASVRATPDTIEQATSWLAPRLAEGRSVIHGLNLDLPIVPTEDALAWNLREERRFQVGPWTDYLAALPALPDLPRYEAYRMPASTPEQREDLRRDIDAYVASFETDYAVLLVREEHRERGRGSRQEHRPYQRTSNELFQLYLRRHGTLIARFTAQGPLGQGGEPLDFEYAAGNRRRSFLKQLLAAERMGPIVEVFDLR